MHISGIALVACLGASGIAQARDVALAETLFRDGRALMDKGDYGAACPKLEESFNQDPATGTLMALAMCQEKAGRTATAWGTFMEVAVRAKRDGRTDREEAARERVQALEPKLSRMTIEVDAYGASVPGFVLKRDGTQIGRAAWGSASPVDPGNHEIEATAPGKKPWKTSVTVGAEKDARTVKVPALEDEHESAAPPPAHGTLRGGIGTPAPAPRKESMEPPSSAGLGGQKIAAIAAGGVGVVGLTVGSLFALKTISSKSDADKYCNGGACTDPRGVTAGNDAHAAGNAATVGMVIGVVGLAGAAALWFTAPNAERSAEVGLGFGTVEVRGTY
jgi:hypothetical protein